MRPFLAENGIFREAISDFSKRFMRKESIQPLETTEDRKIFEADPLVAVVSSAKAEHYLAERGFPSSAYLLTPFSTHTFNMKDPVGRLLPTTVTLDFRDMSKHGHLSPAVLPHVLKKALNSGNNLTVSVANYVECLQRFAGPSELDTFRSFIACIFVISSRDEHPLVELNRLTQLLQSQQHAPKQLDGLRSSPYTSMKWLSANTPKQYVLLHDCTHDEEAKTTECFQQMCAIYGPSYCQILRIGQGISDGLPDIWNRVDSLSRLLDTGVREAFNTTEVSPSVGNRRKHLSELDREECKYLVETFLKKILIPFAERLMRTLAEQLADRRRIGKFMMNGLDGMRKWLGTGQQQEIYNSVTFAPDCKEMKSRRLADLAFQFGLYAYAHEQYQTARKDFEQCQAWLYYASACEMSAVTLRRADPYQSAKYFPVRYLEDAIRHMINGAASQISITLCAINASRILSELQLPKEAALLLTRISSLDNGHFSAILQIYTARCYEKANMNRKAAFYYILAGDCLIKEGMKPVALESYRHALDYYIKDDGAFWPISNKYRTEPESEEIY